MPSGQKELIYENVTIQPKFIGNFMGFIQKKMILPSDSIGVEHYNLTGELVARFSITKDGQVSQVYMDKTSTMHCKPYEEMFINLIKLSSGRWEPGMIKSKKVNCWTTKSLRICFGED